MTYAIRLQESAAMHAEMAREFYAMGHMFLARLSQERAAVVAASADRARHIELKKVWF